MAKAQVKVYTVDVELGYEPDTSPAVALSASAPVYTTGSGAATVNETGTGTAGVNKTGALTAPVYGTDSDGVTFFVFGDCQYKLDGSTDSRNAEFVAAMNVLPGTPYPSALGGNVGTPRGAFVLGDISHGSIHLPDSWDQFEADYGVDGSGTDGTLTIPNYAIRGNHDMSGGSPNYVHDKIVTRHGAAEYVIEWNTGTLPLWLICIDYYPGSPAAPSGTDLSWLVTQLAAIGTTARIIIMAHLGFDDTSAGDWSEGERAAYLAAIADYNVVAHIHGHNHVVDLGYDESGLTCYQMGSPADSLPNQNSVTVFRVTDTNLYANEWELRRDPPAWGQTDTKAV